MREGKSVESTRRAYATGVTMNSPNSARGQTHERRPEEKLYRKHEGPRQVTTGVTNLTSVDLGVQAGSSNDQYDEDTGETRAHEKKSRPPESKEEFYFPGP